MQVKNLMTREDADAAMGAGAAMIFKHSTQCPISAMATKEMETLLGDGEPVPAYHVDVNAQREVSNYIAERTGVTHQSPQVIVLKDGTPTWHTDRFNITATAVRDALGLATPGA